MCRIRRSTPAATRCWNACWCAATARRLRSISTSSRWKSRRRCCRSIPCTAIRRRRSSHREECSEVLHLASGSEETMKRLDHPLPRRAVIKSAGLGVVAAGLSNALPAHAAAAVTVDGADIWSSEYWARKGDVPLWMYRKRLEAPKPGDPSRPLVFFVHGSSVSSRVFDLAVPGHGEYSVMNEFARYGFDCWTMDHENYGKSGRTSGNSDIASGVEDLKTAVEVVARETGRQKFHFLGESSGALRAGAYAMAAPDRVDRLGFAAFTYKAEGSPTLEKRAEQLE